MPQIPHILLDNLMSPNAPSLSSLSFKATVVTCRTRKGRWTLKLQTSSVPHVRRWIRQEYLKEGLQLTDQYLVCDKLCFLSTKSAVYYSFQTQNFSTSSIFKQNKHLSKIKAFLSFLQVPCGNLWGIYMVRRARFVKRLLIHPSYIYIHIHPSIHSSLHLSI